jgi:hypothetical protein
MIPFAICSKENYWGTFPLRDTFRPSKERTANRKMKKGTFPVDFKRNKLNKVLLHPRRKRKKTEKPRKEETKGKLFSVCFSFVFSFAAMLMEAKMLNCSLDAMQRENLKGNL